MGRSLRALILSLVFLLTAGIQQASAISFALDSIAAWGKFPNFCIGVYRWGDKFFNTYDSTYVQGTGYKFNGKVTADSWMDVYNFRLPNNTNINMHSDASTSMGLHLTYLAVSVGYDVNFSKLFGGPDRSRQRLRFGFNCALFAAEAYLSKNDVGAHMTRFGGYRLSQPFHGINNESWGLDVYYFFNNKRYSEAAAFNYSKLQLQSQGSWCAGLSLYSQKLDFDFSELPKFMRDELPTDWVDYHYRVDTDNYAIRFGYGYNWVFHEGWLLGVSETPIVGLRKGYINEAERKWSMSVYNRFKASIVWNSGRWFAGATLRFDAALISNKQTFYAGGVLSGEAAVGYRFNLW
ncbi:MAG: DUF4421 domain-containing protein [Muribaculaceae bacterium]|nr:DUF4421 domain-containing protein [Muribaculaceae bacterium]